LNYPVTQIWISKSSE